LSDIFDIVKLYQEDITKVDYQRKVIDASENARNNKINNNDQGKAIQKNLFVMRIKSHLDQLTRTRKQANPHQRYWHKDYSIWYAQDEDKFIIHIGNIHSGSEIRNIVISMVETGNTDLFVDVFARINRNILRFDNFLRETEDMGTSIYYYETSIIGKLLEDLALKQIPTKLEE